MKNEKPNIWALLVGINDYKSPGISRLGGCCNDVEAIRIFLINQMNVPEGQIKVLRDGGATRGGIIESFQTFLVSNPDIPKGSQLLFHYSGHGSQMRNATGTEPDGLDETIVPHDSRIEGVFDIPDKTLAGLIDRLAVAKGDNITVILDSCHSGSGTRELRVEGATPTRRAPLDDRLPPSGLDADLRAGAAARGGSRSGWAMTRPNHVLLAGCLDREESHEYNTPEGIRHGALTFFALEYLRQISRQATYSDLHAYVKRRVKGLYPNQTPQCEGQRERQVFGGTYVERDPFISVKTVTGSLVIFEAGLVHGLREGTELAIYPASVTLKHNLPAPLATAKVQSVTATTAKATLDDSPQETLPLDAHALVTRLAYAPIRQKVALVPGKGAEDEQAIEELRQSILNAEGGGKPSAYLELAVGPHQPADLRVTAEKGKLSVSNDAGDLLVLPQDLAQSKVVAVRQALESIARYRTILDLANHQQSQIAGEIKLSLRRCAHMSGDACTEAEELSLDAAAPDGGVTLEYDPSATDRNLYVVDITNNSPLKVYPHLFILNPDYSIYRLYPAQGQNEALSPKGGVLHSGLVNSGGYALHISLPGDESNGEYWDLSHESLKLIVTTEPCDLGMLQQDPLCVPAQKRAVRAGGSPFEQLLDAVTTGVVTRGQPYKPAASEDWATAELPYTVVRVSQAKTLGAGQASLSIGDGITLEKPRGFQGQISVAPLDQARRGITDEPSLKLPPGLAHLPEIFQPITRSGTRGLSGQPLVVTLETDEASRALITPENPLRLRLADEHGADDWLPVAFDGEDYLPVGYATGSGGVDVVRVPSGVSAEGVQGAPTRRGIGRAIQLFLFKKLGRHMRNIGLRYVGNKNGPARSCPVRKDIFKPGDRIAVFVHGFLSDTSWMSRDLAPFLRSQVLPYEHLLTWDYETFGTSVKINGDDLATALRQQCGCSKRDELTVHVYAHSMGSLVARCMVELSGGHQFVDRMILAGPPNCGTTLATISRGFTYLLSAMINNLSAVPLVSAANWAVKQLYEQGQGWKDLAVGSEITRDLNKLESPSNVPYLVLAGENSLNQTRGCRLNRLAHKMLDQSLDTLFGEKENDAVIGMSSLCGVRNGAYPALTVERLPCDHFSYFAIAEGQTVVKDWVRSNKISLCG